MAAARPLDGKRILIFVADEYEDLELWYPKLRLEEAGAHVIVAGPEAGKVYRGKHGYPCAADAAIADMESVDFQGVVCPGGWMPDKIRRDPKVLALVPSLPNRRSSWRPSATEDGSRFPQRLRGSQSHRFAGNQGRSDERRGHLGRLAAGCRPAFRLQPQTGRPARFSDRRAASPVAPCGGGLK